MRLSCLFAAVSATPYVTARSLRHAPLTRSFTVHRLFPDRLSAVSRLHAYAGRTFASLAVRNYRFFFVGQAVSLSGTWMHHVFLQYHNLILQGQTCNEQNH